MALGHVAEAPNATRSLSFNGQDFGIPLENSPVLQLQQVEALPPGSGNFLDASDKSLRVSKVLARELPHLACHAALQELSRNLPHIDILLVEVGDLAFLVGHQDRICGRFQRRAHDHERLGKFSRALFENFVRPTNLLLGTLPDLKNAGRCLQDGGPELFCFVLRFHSICH